MGDEGNVVRRQMSWASACKWSAVVGITGILLAATLDALYQGLISKLPFNMMIELPRSVIYFVVWPMAGMLDGVDRPGAVNYGAHAISWCWNGLLYFLVALPTLRLLDRI